MIHRKGDEKLGWRKLAIDVEAYRRLEEARSANESFPEVIKRCVKPRKSAEDVLRAMREAKVSEATIEAIDESVKRRRRTVYRAKE